MELGPIFRALLRNRSRFWLITIEIALTLAIAVNCFAILRQQREKLLRPSGLDEANQIAVTTEPWGEAFEDEAFVDDQREEDLRRLRSLPGVRAAAAFQQIPLSSSGAGTGRKRQGADPAETVFVGYFVVTQGAVETLGVKLREGRAFEASDFPTRDEDNDALVRNVLLTASVADELYPEGALGRVIENDGGEISNVVVGVIEHMHNSWPLSDLSGNTMLLPGRPGSRTLMRYLVRTDPGQVDAVLPRAEEELLAAEPERVVTVRTMQEVRARTYRTSRAMITVLVSVMVLLALVTALGIVGLTAFSVTERTRQIGTRRALGAGRWAILRYFLIENWMVTGFGLALGSALTFGLNVLLVGVAGAPKVGGELVAAAMIGLWLLGQVAALAPALRATRVAPVAATRTI